jgi:hypothetical protein
MRIRFVLLTLAASLAALVPAANANSYNLFCNGTACGAVNISNISGGVDVSVNMTGGYSIQAEAHNGFTVNTVSGLTLTLADFTTTPFGPVTANLVSDVHDAAGAFTFGVEHYGIPTGNTSVTGINFVLLGMSTSSLLANNKGFVVAVHFCSPGSVVTSCPSPTGFTTSRLSVVAEPGTLCLLGTGLLGLAPVLRRKKIINMGPGRKLKLGT